MPSRTPSSGTGKDLPESREDLPESSAPRLIGFPAGVILVALAALVVVPLVTEGRIEDMRQRRLELLHPARNAVNTVQVALTREMAALRGFLISGQESYLARYHEARSAEESAYRKLDGLMEPLGPEFVEGFEELRVSASEWHDLLEEEGVLSPAEAFDGDPDAMLSDEPLYEEAVQAEERLRDLLVQADERQAREVRGMNRWATVLTVVLGLLALGAAILTLWLGRQRVRAWKAERDRREVERILDDRSRLIRGITHDLKNPLGAARGNVQLLQERILSEPSKRASALVRTDRSIGRALEIINDLLELSRAEAGELRVDVQPVNLAALVRETAEEHEAEAERKDVDLRIEVPDHLPVTGTDARRVGEIVRNLVANAVKYTPSGGRTYVRASVRRDGEEGPSGHAPGRRIAIEVADTGPGIAPEEQERVFEEFARVGRSSSDGTGLGLAISREVARLLGGDLTLESEPGEGATFTLHLPLDPDPGDDT